MTYNEAIAILASLPRCAPTEHRPTVSESTVMEAWMHAKPRSKVVRAVDFFGGIGASADALARYAPAWEQE